MAAIMMGVNVMMEGGDGPRQDFFRAIAREFRSKRHGWDDTNRGNSVMCAILVFCSLCTMYLTWASDLCGTPVKVCYNRIAGYSQNMGILSEGGYAAACKYSMQEHNCSFQFCYSVWGCWIQGVGVSGDRTRTNIIYDIFGEHRGLTCPCIQRSGKQRHR